LTRCRPYDGRRVTKTADGLYEVNLRPHGSHEKLLALVGRPERVLDVGCATGYVASRLQAQGVKVVGIELDERAAAQARRFCEAVHVGDVETMELPLEPGSFDAVVCGDFIEHLRDPQAFLARIRPLLRADGRLVLSTPNVANWAMRLGLCSAASATPSGGSSTGPTPTSSPVRLCRNASRQPATA